MLKLSSYSTGLKSRDELRPLFVAVLHSWFFMCFSGILSSLKRSLFTSPLLAGFKFDSSMANILFQGNLDKVIRNKSFNEQVKIYRILSTYMVSLFEKQTHLGWCSSVD